MNTEDLSNLLSSVTFEPTVDITSQIPNIEMQQPTLTQGSIFDPSSTINPIDSNLISTLPTVTTISAPVTTTINIPAATTTPFYRSKKFKYGLFIGGGIAVFAAACLFLYIKNERKKEEEKRIQQEQQHQQQQMNI
jgi:hypothetical protein